MRKLKENTGDLLTIIYHLIHMFRCQQLEAYVEYGNPPPPPPHKKHTNILNVDIINYNAESTCTVSWGAFGMQEKGAGGK